MKTIIELLRDALRTKYRISRGTEHFVAERRFWWWPFYDRISNDYGLMGGSGPLLDTEAEALHRIETHKKKIGGWRVVRKDV